MSEGTFKKLVRSLSRSAGGGGGGGRNRDTTTTTATSPNVLERKGSRKTPGASPGIINSTSPPPDSYFPPPPEETLLSGEASGAYRDPSSLGARAADIGASSQGAPGVSFAPSGYDNPPVQRPRSDVEGWNPPPRRSQSQRVKRTPSEKERDGPPSSSRNRSLGGTRNRAATTGENGSTVMYNGVPLPVLGNSNGNGVAAPVLAAGERRGVQLEDKPLSRKTSVKRATSGLKKAAENLGSVPADKGDGEIRVLILVADGSEEIEVLTPFDVFVRASMGPVLVSVSPQFSPSQSLPYITLSRGARIMADTKFETMKQEYKDDFDAVIIPGGAKGAERLSQDKGVQKLVRDFYAAGKMVGMICAGSLAAKTAGIALGRELTSHPSVKGDLEKHYDYSDDRVVISDNLVTSRGPGTSLEFSLAIVELMAGRRKRDEVEGPMML